MHVRGSGILQVSELSCPQLLNDLDTGIQRESNGEQRSSPDHQEDSASDVDMEAFGLQTAATYQCDPRQCQCGVHRVHKQDMHQLRSAASDTWRQ